jgi:hypothetical protein
MGQSGIAGNKLKYLRLLKVIVEKSGGMALTPWDGVG